MATTPHVITDEQLLHLPNDGSRYEVVDGELVRPGFTCRLTDVLD